MQQIPEAANGNVDRAPASESVRAVSRAIALLSLFSEDHMTWTLAGIAREIGLPKTTVLRLANTLHDEGLIWVGPSGQVSPGPGLLRWNDVGRAAWDLPEFVTAALAELAKRAGETANIQVRLGDNRYVIAQVAGAQALRHVVRLGQPFPLTAGAASRILMIGAPPSVCNAVQAVMTAEHWKEYQERLVLAQTRGYDVAHSERELGVGGIALPIRSAAGEVRGAICIYGPTSRFTDARIDPLVDMVRDARDQLERQNLAEILRRNRDADADKPLESSAPR